MNAPPRITSKLPDVGTTIFTLMSELAREQGALNLSQGFPDFDGPAPLLERVQHYLTHGHNQYAPMMGVPALRAALRDKVADLYDCSLDADTEITVTSGATEALFCAIAAVVNPGDEVIQITPAWPNFEGAAISRGAAVRYVPMHFGNDGWELDLDALFGACSNRTRALFINSPSNPTGWTASEDELRRILEFARARGIWIIADEIYGRFYYGGPVAPSFQTLREPGDRVLFVQTFSKNWAMTGWRMGWLQAPPELGQSIENLIQYNTSGVPSFLQPAGVTALTQVEDFARGQIAKADAGRRIVCEALQPFNNVRFAWPEGAFYLFFSIDGETSSLETALRLVDEANIGVAPGSAFGPGGEGFFRICYLRSPEKLTEAMDRFTGWLRQRNP